jgi:hypothetical protein
MKEAEKKQKIEEAREDQAKLLANCPLDANGQPIVSEALLGRYCVWTCSDALLCAPSALRSVLLQSPAVTSSQMTPIRR